MSSRHRRLRSIAVGILAVAALAGMPGSALGATSITLQPRRQWVRRADPGHECPRRDEPPVRRRAARHDPRRPERRRPAGLLPGHPLEGGRRRRARAAGPCVRPEVQDEPPVLRLLHAQRWRHRGLAIHDEPVPDGGVVASTARPLVLIEHSARANHNGGALAFGPNGYLYIGTGDGGGGGRSGQQRPEQERRCSARSFGSTSTAPDPARSTTTPMPRSNPFAGSQARSRRDLGVRPPEPVADLVRSRPMASSGSRDVGQDRYEEIDREKPGATGGRNYGWDAMEGLHCYTASKCPLRGDTLPNAEYATAAATVRSRVGTSIADRRRRHSSALYVFAD